MRRYLGIGAHEAEHELPAWERELLLDRLKTDLGLPTDDLG